MLGSISRDITSPPPKHEVLPVRYFVAVIAAISIAESLVMVAIHLVLPPQPLVVETILDCFLLAFLLFPFLYIYILNPLLHTITEQKLTEERLRASEQEWEDTFNTISSAITIHDRSFNIVKSNRRAEQLLGLTVRISQESSKGCRFGISCAS
jgi:PAS domain-containing protein